MGKRESKEKGSMKLVRKIITVILFLVVTVTVISLAPNYIHNEITGKTNVIINNNNITNSLKQDILIEDDIIYMATKDIANFLDEDIFYDNQYHQIITGSDTKIASLVIGKNEMSINSVKTSIEGKAIEKDNQFYLPIMDLERVYNIEVTYLPETNRLFIDSLDREKKMANAANESVKYLPTDFSKTLEKIRKGDNVTIIPTKEELKGWTKVRTENGTIGYIKEIANTHLVRQAMQTEKQIEGRVSLVWDYYSIYASAPQRTEKIQGVNVVSPSFAMLKEDGSGDISLNIGTKGKNYIQWAHDNGYKVWAMVSNNLGTTKIKDATSTILRDYQLRENLINNIVNMASSYGIDGINIDFENMYKDDKEMFSRFIIELAPRLKEIGKVLSVDVTAPDGSDDWSLCYDRHTIGKVADYIVFMAYDQYGQSSDKAGTTAGADWVEVNLKKFVGTQEEVESNKIILGMPFYTRLWKETNGTVKSSVISMKNVDTVLPVGVERNWKDDVKQNYIEYEEDGTNYKMWIEDETSLKAKFELMRTYELAGAAYWVKDMEPESIWPVITEELKK